MESSSALNTTHNNDKLKLDFKRTLKVGFAFLGIMLFWEVYDYIMPLILSNYFGLSTSEYGIIMGLDNLLSIFLLPWFGALSDKAVKAKYGRRTSFIFWGSIAAAVSIVFLMIMELLQFKQIAGTALLDMQSIIDAANKAGTPLTDADKTQINGFINQLVSTGYIDAEFVQEAFAQNADFLQAVATIQVKVARNVMSANPTFLIMFILALLFILVSMASYRSPAIALMPDVTPKPLRSQANALITFMGGVGGALSIVVYKIFGAKKYESHIALWLVTAGLLLVILVLYLVFVKEKKFVQQRLDEEEKYGVIDEEEEEAKHGITKLPKEKMISLILILGTVFLWFMGYNCVRSHMSVYATNYLNFDQGFVGTVNLFNGIGGAVALVPCAFLASKLGRKKTIFVGLAIAAAAFIPSFFMTQNTPGVKILFPLCFIISGFGMVFINVNTLPMVTELARGSNVGKYTGYYYVASMTAQAITPYFAGLVMGDNISHWNYMFVYSVVLIAAATITTAFIKYGDSKAEKATGIVDIINQDGAD